MKTNDINKIAAYVLAMRSYPEIAEKINECVQNNSDISSVRVILGNLHSEYTESFERCVAFWMDKLASMENNSFEELRKEYNSMLISENLYVLGKKCEVSDKTIIDRLKEIVEKYPEKIAITDKDTELTYADFWHRVNCCASYLCENGVEKNDVVALEVYNSAETVIRMTAVMLLGAAYLPYDVKSPYDRKKHMINQGGAKFVMPIDGDEDYGKKLIKYSDNFETTRSVDIAQERDSRCYILFTSGTTGKPKGVSIKQYQLSNLLNWYIYTLKIDEDTVFFAMHSFAFDTMFKNTYATLCMGGRVMINYDNEYDFSRICGYIERNKCTHIKSNASVFNALLDASKEDGYRSLRSVRYLFLGGDKFVGENLLDFINSGDKQIQLFNGYGPTEATDISSCHIVSKEELASMQENPVPIGVPIYNQNIYTMSRTGFICGKGIEGEIAIGGIGIADGYEGQSSSKSFSDKLISGDKTYLSGDYAFWNENGELVFTGRKDDMIKFHGYRIFLSEIENAAKTLNFVAETKAVYTDEMIVLFCRALGSERDLEQKLRDVLSKNIASYMMPSKIIFLDEFPRNLNGKTDTEKLCAMIQTNECEEVLYSGEIQKKVSDIWCSILKCEAVAPDVSFFDAGGNSLNLFMLSKKIEKEFLVKIKPVKFIEVSTISQISELIESLI